MTAKLVRVAISGPFAQGLDYLVPPTHAPVTQQDIGKRVSVPLGSRTETGLIIALLEKTDLDWGKLKAFIEILDDEPIMLEPQLDLLHFMRDYYHVSLGDACMTMLPNLLVQGKSLEGRKNRKKVSVGAKLATPVAKNQRQQLLKESHLKLNSAQEKALHRAQAIQENFQVVLLEGVTGSGKTEIYLQLAEKVLEKGGQVLILVPEIGLTPQTLKRFEQRFNTRISSYHSGMSDAERRETWRQGLTDELALVIGTRSSIFLPFKNLKLIIIDEEHDLSFKQQSGVYYSAKSLAIKRAQQHDIPIILGSATPSLESLHQAEIGRYLHLKLPERAGVASKVKYQIIDMRGQPKKSSLSESLLNAIAHHLAKGEQVLVFLNRRGYAPILLCNSCGHQMSCQDCDISFTLHQHPKMLMCHHCGIAKRIPNICPKCARHNTMLAVGLGTEQVEEQLKQHFPEHHLIRVDQDATRGKGSLENLLEEISSERAKIIVGTQMLAKGHHFASITMVGIVDLDYGLFAPDFRALERMGQLLLQVAGRAGRGEKAGTVYLQTHQPEHPYLQLLLSQTYPEFAKALLKDRAESHWPPFSFLALLRAEAKDEQAIYDFLNQQKAALRTINDEVMILGPVPAFLSKKAGRHRAQLLLQSNKRKSLHQILQRLEQQLAKTPSRKIRWSIDVDPQELG